MLCSWSSVGVEAEPEAELFGVDGLFVDLPPPPPPLPVALAGLVPLPLELQISVAQVCIQV